jgi:hypothetical protein
MVLHPRRLPCSFHFGLVSFISDAPFSKKNYFYNVSDKTSLQTIHKFNLLKRKYILLSIQLREGNAYEFIGIHDKQAL